MGKDLAQGTTLPTATIQKEVGTSCEIGSVGKGGVRNSKLLSLLPFLKSKRESLAAELPGVRSTVL